MKMICWLIITIELIIPISIDYRKSKDLFSPVVFFNFYTFLSTVPRIVFMEYNLYTHELSNGTINRYLLITSLFIISVNIAFFYKGSTLRKLYLINNKYVASKDSVIIPLPFIYGLFLIGVFSKVYLLQKVGGLSIIWSNINRRTLLLAGNNYINNLEILLLISSALIFMNFLNTNKEKYLGSMIVIIISSSLLLLSFGGRAGFVRLFMLLFFIANYHGNYLNAKTLLSVRNLFILGIVALVIVMLPMVRSSDYSTIYSSPIVWIQTGFKNLGAIFENISSVDRDMCAYDIFSNSSKWYGKSYLSLLTAWIPSSIYSNKPPVDDGVYLANLINGFNVAPIMPYSDIPLHSSSPFSSAGIMFANFGYIGVIAGGFISGIMYCFSYKSMVIQKRTIRTIVTYGYVMLLFGLSVHSLLSVFVPWAIISVVLRRRKYHISFGRRRIL